MVTVVDVAQPFASALHTLATGYNALSETLLATQRSAWRGGMGQLVRKYHDIVIPAYSSLRASEAALREAHRRGIDLYRMEWRQQTKIDRGRKVFHLEHVVPVATVVQRCLAATEYEILTVLTTDALQVAWILKEEDRRLDALGVRTIRPDPEGAYRAAGIVLVSAPSCSYQ